MKKLILILVCIALLSLPLSVMAATEAQKQAAIDAGLAYLASQQVSNGSWNQTGYADADTASALLAFTEQYYKPISGKPNGWNGQDYSAVVMKAANFLLGNAGEVNIASGAWWGNTSNDASNKGLIWGGGEATYVTGIVLPALSRLTAGINGITPGTVIASANPAVNGLTYKQVIQRTVDMFEWGQNGGTNTWIDGGWRYVPKQASSDGSTTQWPAIAMLFAQNVPGITVAAQTKSELIKWMKYDQYTAAGFYNGASGYDSPANIPNASKTGGLLVEIAFTGHDTALDGMPGKAGALAFLSRDWLQGPSGWDGNIGQPYAMWSVYKGLASTIGLDNMTAISNLNTDPGDVDNPNHGWNWWEDYCNWLVLTQKTNGSWDGYSNWPSFMATGWYINILNATEVGPPPNGEVPEPATMILLGSGLIGLAGYARKRMKK